MMSYLTEEEKAKIIEEEKNRFRNEIRKEFVENTNENWGTNFLKQTFFEMIYIYIVIVVLVIVSMYFN